MIPGVIVQGIGDAHRLAAKYLGQGYDIWMGAAPQTWARAVPERPAEGVYALLVGAPHPIVGVFHRDGTFVPRTKFHKVVIG